jgi:uncharacterized membrane protein YfcA
VNALLFAATLAAGALNAVAGGGSFITLPALLFAGVTPVAANATSTFAVWPASVASAVAYRRELGAPRTWVPLGAVSLLGGLFGGLLLVKTSDSSFMRLLPWLMLLGALTFTFGGAVTKRLGGGVQADALPWWMFVLQLAIATYGGYFGGGMGIMMLAMLAAVGMTDIHEMNGLKAVLGVAINAVALVTFVANGAIVWQPGIVMAAGGIIGGYAGGAIARRLSRDAVRWFVILVAWTMTAYFFVRG